MHDKHCRQLSIKAPIIRIASAPFLLLLLFTLVLGVLPCAFQSAQAAQADPAAEELPSDLEQTPEPIKPKKTKKKGRERPTVVALKPQDFSFKDDIDHFSKPDQLKPLLAGDEEFYALFHEDMTGRPRGVALLIPDWGQQALSSRGLEYLRTTLPNFGWVTLSIMVPQSPESVYFTPTATDAPDPAPALPSASDIPLRQVNESFMQQYQTQMKLRMLALIAEAENYQGYFIVIAQGSSAAVLANLYNTDALTAPEAFIILSAFVPDMALSQQMNQDITATSIPTLDIYQYMDSRWIQDNIKIRQKLARKNFKVAYRQTKLFGDISYHNQNRRLMKVTYGWLSSLGL